MSRISRSVLSVIAVPLASFSIFLSDSRQSTGESPTVASDSVERPAVRADQRMTARIDELLTAAWAGQHIDPAPLAGDAEFLRRVSLDLTGTVPTVSEVRTFLADTHPEKRARVIDRLLDSHRHADHLATTWRNMMVPRGSTVDGFDGQAGLQRWLRTEFAKNARYDQMVADLLVATGAARQGPGLFFTAFDLKPEELAANTARMFLGIQIECAQCHDHPFDRWTQQDFWGYAAFFARLGRDGDMRPGQTMRLIDKRTGEVMLPATSVVVPPRYPRGEVTMDDNFGTRRMKLGVWMVSRDNPFLARAAVNRVWANLFGRGLVEPVDDLSDRNPASHPELFDELAAYFTETGYDLRNLLRTLANTRAYQLSSRTPGDEPVRPELFARATVRSLTAEQLYDSMIRVALVGDADAARGQSDSGFDVRRQAFVAKMQSQTQSRLDYDAGVAQVLELLNGSEIATATAAPTSGMLAALEAPAFTDRERVEILFLATLARSPDEHELARSLEHLAQGNSAGGETSSALGDILWALANSAEFGLNH
jgi:Protein of unknown function (DUF1549)/Protein of unknown function (DUF1553)